MELLRSGDVTELSLDHDLGFGFPKDQERSGEDVITWLEQSLLAKTWHGDLPSIYVHSGNAVARVRMELAIESLHARVST